ncbi:hypothetical protein EJB05_09232, partial [Eragrostis curvula]
MLTTQKIRPSVLMRRAPGAALGAVRKSDRLPVHLCYWVQEQGFRPLYKQHPYLKRHHNTRSAHQYTTDSEGQHPRRRLQRNAFQIENHHNGAEIVKGDATCRKKSIELLEELGLPKGLLPLEDIQEFGYNRATGFMWLVQGKKKVEHTFKKIKQTVSYAAEVTAFAEKGKLRKITGVKTQDQGANALAQCCRGLCS